MGTREVLQVPQISSAVIPGRREDLLVFGLSPQESRSLNAVFSVSLGRRPATFTDFPGDPEGVI